MNPQLRRVQTGIDQSVETTVSRILNYQQFFPPDAESDAAFKELRRVLLNWLFTHNPSDEIPLVICSPANTLYFTVQDIEMSWYSGHDFIQHLPDGTNTINVDTCPKPRTVKIFAPGIDPVQIIHR